MYIIEYFEKATEPLISFEIIPPLRGGSFEQLEKVICDLAAFNPPFIDVTSHASKVEFIEAEDGFQKRVQRKRPGTLGICAVIQHKYKIEAVPHILGDGFTREETEDFLIDLSYVGIKNVLALKGDSPNFTKPTPEGKTSNAYAKDLVAQIRDMNKGKYLRTDSNSQSTNFGIGVAGYPEKHFQAPNITADIQRLKEMVEAGASYIVAQMFFDNQKYFSFVEQCREAGIKAPIIPGLKILTTKNHLTSLPSRFKIDIPYELSEEVGNAEIKHVQEIGINWAYNQAAELLNQKVPAVHFYVMGDSGPVSQVVNWLRR